MTVLIVGGIAVALLALGLMRKRRVEKRQFDERSDVTKMVLAADRRRKDANAALRFMHEK
jgi:hypothetical protein